MITYVDFGLFESPAQTLVNTVNTVGVMGKGIAAVFKRVYPEMYQEYRRLCQSGQLDIGKLFVYRTPNKIIVNFPTKKHWRQPSRVEYIEAGLDKFVERYQGFGVSSVSFPQLGCGHGELNWERQVQPAMEKYLKNMPFPVYIHLYSQLTDFIPERLDASYTREVRLERQRVSSDQLWQGLQKLASGGSGTHYQLSLFGPSIEVNDEYIRFKPFNGEPVLVYREDIEDLWNILRLRGTVLESEVSKSIRDAGASEWVLEFLSRLSYIRPVPLRSHRSQVYERGLRYTPSPEPVVIEESHIIV